MTKQETIKRLTDLLATISGYYFKGRLEGCRPWVHEGDEEGAAISIDLYNFGGDGEPVCDGLKPCTITYDDGSQDIGHLFCMIYDPEDVTPLVFLFSPEDESDDIESDDIEIDPEDVPEGVLQNILTWLESEWESNAKPEDKPKKNDVTSFFYYMWNRWSEEECRIAFKDGDYNHFWSKWCEAYDTMKGPRGAAELFYMMLSDTNRDKLVKRALECYDGMCEG